METNKIIAEFMQKSSETFEIYDYNGSHYKLNKLQFHTSWDWLMPVVKKIDDLFGDDDDVDDMINKVHNLVLQFDIFILHTSVVEFIKFYNNKNK